jgi:hypothetical protein
MCLILLFATRNQSIRPLFNLESVSFQRTVKNREEIRKVCLNKGAVFSGVSSFRFGGIHFTTVKFCAYLI